MARPNGRDVARALDAAREGNHETLRLLTTGRKAASAPLVSELSEKSDDVSTRWKVPSTTAPSSDCRGAPNSTKVLGEALRAAAESGQVDALKALLQFGAPAAGVPGADKDRTPLAAACAGGHTECIAALLACGAQGDDTALTAALRGDHSGCLRALITNNGSLNAQSLARLPGVLVVAAGHDALTCMDELCRLGCDPCTEGSATFGTPLSAACEEGFTRAVAWLLEHGAPVDAAPYFRRDTALWAACCHGHADCAALLIHHGADVDLADSSGEAPLAAALRYGHAVCATLLLDHGARAAADCLIDSGFGRHSPSTSCWCLVPRLLAAGAVTDCRDQRGITPLAAAAGYGTSAAVRALCAVRADTWAACNDGRLPLHSAAAHYLVVDVEEETDTTLLGQIENGLACADELIERGGAETLIVATTCQFRRTALERGVKVLSRAFLGGVNSSVLQLMRDGCPSLLLARWPLSVPLPEYDGVEALLRAAVGHAQRRLEVLRSGQDDAGMQQALTAAFQRRVRDACGGALAPAHAPFARLRFVAGGGLERAWAGEREVHRFPVERVALARAALEVAADAQAAAAERCMPLLRELSAVGSSREAGKLRYAAAVAVGRWGAIRAAVSRAEEGVRSGKAALDAAIAEAEAQVSRLQQANAEAPAG